MLIRVLYTNRPQFTSTEGPKTHYPRRYYDAICIWCECCVEKAKLPGRTLSLLSPHAHTHTLCISRWRMKQQLSCVCCSLYVRVVNTGIYVTFIHDLSVYIQEFWNVEGENNRIEQEVSKRMGLSKNSATEMMVMHPIMHFIRTGKFVSGSKGKPLHISKKKFTSTLYLYIKLNPSRVES
jgi:hypothetical protein